MGSNHKPLEKERGINIIVADMPKETSGVGIRAMILASRMAMSCSSVLVIDTLGSGIVSKEQIKNLPKSLGVDVKDMLTLPREIQSSQQPNRKQRRKQQRKSK